MPTQTFSYSQIYNTIEKVEAYWNQFKPLTPTPGDFGEKWLSQQAMLDQLSQQSAIVITLWDVSRNRFIFYTDKRNVTGHQPCLVTAESGIDFAMSNHHPDYLTPGLIMQQKGITYCLEHPSLPQNQITLNMESLFRRSDGSYFKSLQQAIPVEVNAAGQPLLFLSYLHDISHLKKAGTAGFVITSPQEVQIWNYNFDTHSLENVKPLSQQEKKVLDLLSQGKESKEIAHELYISPHTADTHRRNLLQKTNCVDTTALVTYARIVGLL